ncbi:serine/threonine-protein kinase 17A-like [Argonauta hians]
MNGCNAHVAMGSNKVAEETKVDILTPRTPINTEPLTSKYSVQGELGRGKFAVVKKCVNLETNEEVAAKFIRKRRRGKNCREQILREIVMLELSRPHHRVVDLIEVFESQTEMILITEYCSGGELFHECVIEESFKESDVVRLLGEILEGVLFLHHKNILHLDLKPQNILLTKPFPEGNIKICDLGLACLVNDGEDIREIVGTPDYVAPEVLSYEPLGLSTDMWSLGVLTYVMLSACSPFDGESKQETYLNISQVNLEFPDYLFESISYGAIDFMKNLLIKDPRCRMDAAQCLAHAWLRGEDVPRPIELNQDDEEEEEEEEVEDREDEKQGVKKESEATNSENIEGREEELNCVKEQSEPSTECKPNCDVLQSEQKTENRPKGECSTNSNNDDDNNGDDDGGGNGTNETSEVKHKKKQSVQQDQGDGSNNCSPSSVNGECSAADSVSVDSINNSLNCNTNLD